jgi:hypothetical protein
MISIVSIYTGGILTLFMALFHTRFYTLFKWRQEYEKISSINRRIFYTIHLALMLLFLLIGLLTVLYARELAQCNGIALGFNVIIAIFWLWRALWQVVYFESKGRVLHFLLIVWFFILCFSYSIPVIFKLV